jgi:hypothetical protein
MLSGYYVRGGSSGVDAIFWAVMMAALRSVVAMRLEVRSAADENRDLGVSKHFDRLAAKHDG